MHPATWKINSLTLVGAFHCFGLVRRSPGLLPCSWAPPPPASQLLHHEFIHTRRWSSRTLFHQGHRRTSRTAEQNVRFRLEISRSCSWHSLALIATLVNFRPTGRYWAPLFSEQSFHSSALFFFCALDNFVPLRDDRCRCVCVYTRTFHCVRIARLF